MHTLRIAIAYLLDIISWVIVVKSLFTWVPALMDTKLYQIMDEITEPIEGPIRRILYKNYSGPVDFSPVIAIIILIFLKGLVL